MFYFMFDILPAVFLLEIFLRREGTTQDLGCHLFFKSMHCKQLQKKIVDSEKTRTIISLSLYIYMSI